MVGSFTLWENSYKFIASFFLVSKCKNHSPLSLWSGLVTFWLIAYFKPDIFFIQILGFVMFSYFILGTLIGSWFHPIAKLRKIEGDTEGSILAFIVGLIVLIYFWSYYYPIGSEILNNLLLKN